MRATLFLGALIFLPATRPNYFDIARHAAEVISRDTAYFDT